jgi:uncharacterized RDD family membrane protein YckC
MIKSTSLPITEMQKRISAFVIDDIVVSIFFMIIFYNQLSALFLNISVTEQVSLETINIFITENILVFFAIKVLYHTVLIWQNGMTFGKYVTKTKVIELDTGDTPSLQKSFIRASIRLISETLFYAGFIMAFFLPMRQTLHDKFSNCVVIDA